MAGATKVGSHCAQCGRSAHVDTQLFSWPLLAQQGVMPWPSLHSSERQGTVSPLLPDCGQ